MSIRVLIVDDHSVVRQGLQMFLSLDPDIETTARKLCAERENCSRMSS